MPAAERNDLSIYDRHADGWWQADDRTFRSLRAVSEYRLAWLLRHLPFPLAGTVAVDLGCGGGLLALPLAARGAQVFGLDRSLASLRAARQQEPAARLLCADLHRCPLPDASADLVLLADVLEHVDTWPAAVREAARLLRAGGALYVNTINRTLRARVLAVRVAEGIGLVPRGTHDAALFVRPDELGRVATGTGLRCHHLAGEAPRLWATLRSGAIRLRASRSLALAYAALFVKEPA